METGAANLRRGRITHAVFAVTILLYVYMSEIIAPPDAKVSTLFVAAITGLACVIALVAYQFRRKKLQPALAQLRKDPNDPEALKSWRFGTIVPSVFAESIGLFGFLFRIVGAGRRVSWPFFLASLVLLATWRPRMDLSAASSRQPAI